MSYFFQLRLMLHAYVRRFDVMGTVKKILELNKTLVVSTKLSSDLPLDSSATISKIEIPLLRWVAEEKLHWNILPPF